MDRTDPEAFLPLKAAHFHILLSLAEASLHGYGIRQAVEERTGGVILLAAGTLYETLQRMERNGLLEQTEAPEAAVENASSRWRFYSVTPLGRSVLTSEVRRLESDLVAARSTLSAQ